LAAVKLEVHAAFGAVGLNQGVGQVADEGEIAAVKPGVVDAHFDADGAQHAVGAVVQLGFSVGVVGTPAVAVAGNAAVVVAVVQKHAFTGAAGAAKTIENLSVKLTQAITGFGYLVQEVKIAQPILITAGALIFAAWSPWLAGIAAAALAIGAIGNAMRKNTPQVPVNTGKLMFPTAGDGGYKERLAAEKKAEADAAKRARDLAAMTKANLKAQKDALKLAKAKSIFDLEKIQIEAALKGKLSEEDKIRLKLLKAIVDENISDVEKYEKALTAAQAKTKELSELLATIKTMEIKDPFGTWSIDPLTAAINELTQSIGGVGTKITATGVEWSSFANTVANTVIRPNLSEWSSSFSNANKAASDAAAAASATLTTTTSAATKAAADAAAASAAAIAAANKASAEAIAKAEADAAAALEKLKNESAAATAAANKAAQDAIDAANKTASETVASILAAASAAAAAAAASSSTVNTTTLDGIIAASGSSTNSTTTNVEITVTAPPFTDPNAIAEAVDNVLRNARDRGTLVAI